MPDPAATPGPRATVHHGNSLAVLAGMPDCSVDSIVTDPPYELGFMGKGWDSTGIAYSVPLWTEALRVLKPGGHLIAFGATRTYHRLASAVEDSGFEIRDSFAWLYGSGFPKSLDVSKAIDRAAGATRELTRPGTVQRGGLGEDWDSAQSATRPRYDIPATPDAQAWHGWGTALKPAFEPAVLARKPLSAGTVAGNVLAWGTGALNIDGTRVATDEHLGGGQNSPGTRSALPGDSRSAKAAGMYAAGPKEARPYVQPAGRWPANVLLSHTLWCDPDGGLCDPGCPVLALDQQSGTSKSRNGASLNTPGGFSEGGTRGTVQRKPLDDQGGASRFFPTFRYQAKAPSSERPVGPDGTRHATVKPLALMRHLIRLVTPPGGTVLDPFAGSGTTLEAALLEGFSCVGVELEAAHLPLIEQRLHRATGQPAPAA